jgi:hypothetical protein
MFKRGGQSYSDAEEVNDMLAQLGWHRPPPAFSAPLLITAPACLLAALSLPACRPVLSAAV